jgi:hypothetical protein
MKMICPNGDGNGKCKVSFLPCQHAKPHEQLGGCPCSCRKVGVCIPHSPAVEPPEGYELVTDRGIQKDDNWKYWSVSLLRWEDVSTWRDDQSQYVTYARPIVKPAVKCPVCSGDMVWCYESTMSKTGQRHWFKCWGCWLNSPKCDTKEAAIAVITRIRIEPEPLVCPRCNGPVEIRPRTYFGIDGFRAECCSCIICGTFQGSQKEAESEFRKLKYEGGK